MHTKNRSFMSPLYDVATTAIYDSCYGYESHLTINGKQQNIRPNDFKVICQKLDVSFSDFVRLAREMALIYADKMPHYIERLKTLGSLPFYTRKPISSYSKDKRALKEEMEFSDILEKKFFERVEKLKEFGWLVV
jgi:serine/threonine-protein kinase HipA